MKPIAVLVFAYGVLALAGANGLDVDVLARGSGGMHVAAQEGLDSGLQAAFGAGVTAEAMTRIGLGGGLTLAWDYALASPVQDLVSYRGYSGVRLALFGAWRQPERATSPLSLGLRAGVLGSFLSYTNTQSYFVAPGLFVEPTLNLRFSRFPWLVLGASVPVVWMRRADLQFSGEAGLAIEAGVRLPVGGGVR